MWGRLVEPNFPAYEACLTLRNERFVILPLFFLARISARTWRTVSLRQIVSMGWRAFFKMSTICRGEVSRYKSLAIGEQVIFRGAADSFRQAFAELTLQKAHDLADALQGESPAPQLADHGDLGEVFHRIQPAAPFPCWNHNAALVPPLQLAGRDPGERTTSRDVNGCCISKTENVSNNHKAKCLKHFRRRTGRCQL